MPSTPTARSAGSDILAGIRSPRRRRSGVTVRSISRLKMESFTRSLPAEKHCGPSISAAMRDRRQAPQSAATTPYYVGATKFYAINPDGSLKWSYDTGHYIEGPPAIAKDGTLYFPSTDYLYAVNPDGSLKWRSLGHADYPLGSAPAIGSDGTIYLNTYDGTLHAYAPDGYFKWKFATPGIVTDVPSSPAIAKDGTIYFGGAGEYEGSGGYFYALTPNGKLKWSY